MRFPQALATALLLAAGGLAQAAEIIVTAREHPPALQRFAAELAARRPQDQLRLATPEQLGAPSTLPADSRLILLGPTALDWRLGDTGGPATLVMQISRVQAQQRLGERRPARLTLLWSDPAPARQLRLIRQLLPQTRRVAVLYGDDSRFLIHELRHQAAAQGLAISAWYWPDSSDSRPLNRALDEGDVLLGIDDPQLFNPRTLKTVLLASYGRKQAMIGPTAAFVRPGSLSSTYSDQNDWLDDLDRLLSLPPTQWPREAYPRHFKVLGNPQVARSLGIELGDDHAQARRLQDWERQR